MRSSDENQVEWIFVIWKNLLHSNFLLMSNEGLGFFVVFLSPQASCFDKIMRNYRFIFKICDQQVRLETKFAVIYIYIYKT